MKHLFNLLICSSLFAGISFAQTAIPNTTAVTQNFDAMAATTTLPSNWKMHASTSSPNYSTASGSVTQFATGGTPATGGTYNFGATTAERSVGAMTSSGFASPNNLLGYFRNTNSNAITDLTIAYDAERFRINSAAASVQFFYSLNGSTWTAVTSGDIATSSFPTGTSTYTFASPTIINKTNITISGLNIANGSDFYLRWNINTTGGNSQAIGIDNISVTATFAAGCTAPSTQISSLVASSPLTNGFSSSWTLASGDPSLIAVRPTAQSVANPVSGTAYTATTDYTTAGQINSNNRVVYSAVGTSVSVTGLSPQTSYTVTGYSYASATNCYNTTSAPSTAIMTLSEAVSSQASSLNSSNPTTTSIDLTIGAATFPSIGATKAGYVIIYSTGTPTFTAVNGTAPTAGVGTIFTTASSTLPSTPATSVTVTGLSSNTSYNFLVIPYTWDGTNASTYNYLTVGAQTAAGATTGLTAPVVNSPTATSIVNTLATLGGTVVSDGGDAITERGIVWSLNATNSNPTIGGLGCSFLTTSGTTGVFTINVTGLPTGSTIAYVAYATNGIGTTYSTVGTFTTNTSATQLAYGTVPPTSGNVSQNLTAFTVEARRADNSVDAEFTGAIVLTQLSGSGSMTGTTTVNAVSGIATFNTVQFNQASTYTIQGSFSGLTATSISSPIVVTIADDAVGEWINATGGTTWFTTTNWTNSVIPTGQMFARFNNTGTATTCAVNVNTGNPVLSGIEVSSLRTRALSIGANVTTSGTMTLNGGYNNQLPNTIIRNNSNSLLSFVPNVSSSGSLNIVLGNATENVVRVDGTGDVTISSIISGTNRNLTKAGIGSGKLILSGNNTYSGETRINTGTIEITANERIANASNLVLNGGDFSTGASTGFTETVGTLNVSNTSTIHLGTGVHTLTFAASNGVVWNGTSLTIFGWTGTNGVSGTAGKIFVGTSSTGLTTAQLAKISFNGFAGHAIQLSTGEIVPQTFGPTNAVLSGTSTICAGGSTDLAVTVTGGTAPFTVVYNNGVSDVTVLNYTSGTNIAVSPSATTTYTLVSVTDANTNPSDAVSGTAIVTVNNATSGSENVTTCDSYTWAANSTTYTTSGTYTATLTNAAGCDSIATLNLTINTVGTVANVSTTSITANSALVTWDAIAVPVGGNFTIQYRLVGAPSFTTAGSAPVGATSFSLTGLTQASNYEVQVAANCSAQSSGTFSTTHTFTTLTAGCGAAMVINAGTNSGNAVQITWTAVPSVSWYEFRYKETASGTWISGGTLSSTYTSKSFTGLNGSTSYDFQARTFCGSGVASPWSSTLTVTTNALTGCSLPPVIATGTITGTSATITWPAVSGAAWYEFRYKTSASGTWISGGSLGSTATSKTITGLTGATAYDFQARTYCSSGIASAWSATLSFTTNAPAACEVAPVISTSTITNTSATITWPAVAGAGWYEFRYKLASSSTWISAGTLGGTATSKTISGLTAGSLYDFQAKTYCNASSSSAWGTTLQFTTTGAAAIAQNNEITEIESTSSTIASSELGVETIGSPIEVVVYPNPTSNDVTIRLNVDEAQLTIYNAQGTIIQSGAIATNSQVSLKGYEAGVYFFEVKSANGSTIKRIVKQ